MGLSEAGGTGLPVSLEALLAADAFHDLGSTVGHQWYKHIPSSLKCFPGTPEWGLVCWELKSTIKLGFGA